MELLKENVALWLKDQKNKTIFISSSVRNLEYYYSKLMDENLNVYFFKTNTQDKRELLDVNIKLIDVLSKKEKSIIIIDFVLAMSIFFEKVEYFNLELFQNIKLNELEQKLISFGYNKNYLIEQEGEYSRRGDIIDIFSPNNSNPVRLAFFDIEIEKIKFFDIQTQKSCENLNKISIYSNNLYGKEVMLTKLSDLYYKADIILENKELLEYNLENLIYLDEENEKVLRERFEQINNAAISITVLKTEGKNYQNEISVYKENLAKKGIKYQNISQIKKGDYVIHVQYGIGIYEGLEVLNDKEWLSVRYADEDKLYIPIDSLNRLEKYIGSKSEAPILYKLGRRGFKRKEKRLKADIEKMARELIEIQAKRTQNIGIKFVEDSIWQQEFEEGFEFEETKDQKQAIFDVKNDMQSGRVMDRIICGDVGYGKTEVAMRAAFKAIESGYQVALLAPTTILANQHYERFKKRFEKFPVNIEVFSRISNCKEKMEKFKNKEIDLVIGTHKILGKEFDFSGFGLLIVDEEQKFGVKAKEKIKSKRNNIDILTLTATPIPRTLNLALLGIRDISIISTPPSFRLPVKTEVKVNINEKELQKIILKEISRDGQVFYVSNDVKNMERKADELRKILPNFVKVDYIHGQLAAKDIKSKIQDFENDKFQVLLCSTIIENGIDIPNANTIIIENFNKLGLSQIYQLRGRVGRAKRQAYCYLLRNENISKKGALKHESIKEIENMSQAGYKLSMEDMQIRGAGEILGEKQHGAIETFGYDLYLKLLNEEISKQKGNKKNKLENVDVVLKGKKYIPDDYINDEQRIIMYKRLSEAQEISEIKEIEEEMEDRFGNLPDTAKNYLIYLKAKIYASFNFISSIYEQSDGKIKVQYVEKSSLLNSNMVTFNKEKFLELLS